MQSKNHQLNDKHRQIGLGHSGQRGLSQAAYHKRIHQTQQGGAQVLQQDGQGQ